MILVRMIVSNPCAKNIKIFEFYHAQLDLEEGNRDIELLFNKLD